MPTSSASRYARARALPWQKIQSEVVVVLPQKRRIFLLNATGSFLWNLLEKPKTVQEMAEALTEEFEITFENALKDLEKFVKALLEEKIVTVSDDA